MGETTVERDTVNAHKMAKAQFLVDPGDFTLWICKRAGFGGLV